MAAHVAESNRTWSPEVYIRALRFSASKHNAQLMTDSQLPYVVHVCMVAAEVKLALAVESFEQPDLALQCALLHDTMEDTDTPYEEIANAFGVAVADGVRALTKEASLPKPQRMRESLRRIREQPREVWIVKLADRITNLQPAPSCWSVEKRRRYGEEAREICAALGSASEFLRRRLSRKIGHYLDSVEQQQDARPQ
jgi:(p)ppGpp synthase/HD superfamily hydrolase